MIATPSWTVIEHQVIKPMMIPQRHNYDEEKSLIPNVYQCRSSSGGSHFTAIRILRVLRSGATANIERIGYHNVAALVDEFDSRFSMRADCEAALDVMLRHGLIEANNRLDAYRIEKSGGEGGEMIYADEVRITAFGAYMLEDLSKTFTYLDLVSLDCGISNEALYHGLCERASRERDHALGREKLPRLDSRLVRTRLFINYLKGEEAREKTEFLLQDSEDIVTAVLKAFDEEEPKVRSSGFRNIERPHERQGSEIKPRRGPVPHRSYRKKSHPKN